MEPRCATCQFFTPDTIGSGVGIGNCQKYDEYKAKGANEKKLEVAYRKLGNELFWGGLHGRPRNCTKYEERSDGI
jgi:predicted aldo/keto reductase-like oxidoreductase